MVARRSFALLLAVGVAGATASDVLAARNFPGTARDAALTAGQAKYKVLTGSAAAATPAADRRRGFRSGWQASYLKGTPKAPVEAYALIYVYAKPADASRAYARSCNACTGKITIEGIRMKFQYTNDKGTKGVINVAACRNVYVAIVVTGNLTAGALARNAGSLAGGIYAKARAGGMTPCG